jgi:hypothetical protein
MWSLVPVKGARAYPLSLAVVCVGCLVWEARLVRAHWTCASPSGRRWATCDAHTREYPNMPCSMRRTMTAAEAEGELLARYDVPGADLPVAPGCSFTARRSSQTRWSEGAHALIKRLAAAGTTVVSDDREVCDGAVRAGARTMTVGDFVRRMRRAPGRRG